MDNQEDKEKMTKKKEKDIPARVYNLIWTFMWFSFILILLNTFKTYGVLWLLLVWIIGINF